METDDGTANSIALKPAVVYNPYKRAKHSIDTHTTTIDDNDPVNAQRQQEQPKQVMLTNGVFDRSSASEEKVRLRNSSFCSIQDSVDERRVINKPQQQGSEQDHLHSFQSKFDDKKSGCIDIYDDEGIDWDSIPDYSSTLTTEQQQQIVCSTATATTPLSATSLEIYDGTKKIIPHHRQLLSDPFNSCLKQASVNVLSSDGVASSSTLTKHAPSRCTSTAATVAPLPSMEASTSNNNMKKQNYSLSRQLPRPPEWCHNYSNIPTTGVNSSSNTRPSKVSSSLTNRIVTQEGKLLPPLPPELSYDPSRLQPIAVDSDQHRRLVEHANLSAPLKNGWNLMPHQKHAILQGLQMRRLVVAYDMGLGKTALACVWANAFQKTFVELKVFVVAPVSLQREWKNTASTCTDLVMMEDDNLYGLEVASWGKIPSAPLHQFVVIADEAHSMQSITSQRTKDMLSLLSDINCVGCLLLTGTPMKNGKPANLFPLLKGVRHPLGDNQRAYEVYFCNGHSKNFGKKGVVWDATGSSNLDQLRAHIASHVIHMAKEDCLEGLPGKTREYRQIQVSSKFEYRYQAQLRELAAAAKVSAANNNDDSDAVLGAFTRVRQISSFSKIDATVALARSILENEPAVVIFTCFVDVAKSVHQKLDECGWSGELLTGQTPGNKRQEMVDNFQSGLSSVFISTFGAGGVGLTLTAACTIILLDRPWTPGEQSLAASLSFTYGLFFCITQPFIKS